MPKVIHKYPLLPDEKTRMPKGATLLRTEIQRGDVCVWAEVDPAAETVERQFHLVPTGGEVPPGTTYVGTVFSGAFVSHVYVE